MYTKPKRLISDNHNLSNYVEGFDIYNSLLLNKLTNPDLEKEVYIIKSSEYRPDLVARDFYGDVTYAGLVVIQSRLNLSDFVEGAEILLIPKNILDNIIKSVE